MLLTTGLSNMRKIKRLFSKKKAVLVLAFILAVPGIANAGRMSVRVEKANIRSGPGTGYEAMWMVEKYHPIMILKCVGKWCHISDFEGEKGWLRKDLLDKTSSVITKCEDCNVRSGPGTGYKTKMKNLPSGVPFKVLKTKGRWLNIRHKDGLTGWIHSSLVW